VPNSEQSEENSKTAKKGDSRGRSSLISRKPCQDYPNKTGPAEVADTGKECRMRHSKGRRIGTSFIAESQHSQGDMLAGWGGDYTFGGRARAEQGEKRRDRPPPRRDLPLLLQKKENLAEGGDRTEPEVQVKKGSVPATGTEKALLEGATTT